MTNEKMSDFGELVAKARKLAALAYDATPGPWESRSFPEDVAPKTDRWVAGPATTYGYRDICDVRTSDIRDRGETMANARLIAAAPEMAELLKQLADALEAER